MPTKPSTESLRSIGRARYPTAGYLAKFGEDVPADLLKAASQCGFFKELDASLQAQIDKGEPVTDWVAFAQPLLAPFRASASASGQRSTT